MPIQTDINEAKRELFVLAEKAWAGEQVIITRNGKPCLELRPLTSSQAPRMPGRLAGKIHMAADFDELPSEITDAFEGRS